MGLIDGILIKMLNSGNSNYHHKYLILRIFDKIAKNPKHLIEIFVNYDCNLKSKDLLQEIIETLSKISQGQFAKAEHTVLITEREERSLKLYALKILSLIVSRLNLYLEMDQHQEQSKKRQKAEED